MKAIVVKQLGPPEVLELKDLPLHNHQRINSDQENYAHEYQHDAQLLETIVVSHRFLV